MQRTPLAFGAPAAGLVQTVPAGPLLQPGSPQLDLAALRRAQHYLGTIGPWSHLCLRFVRNVFGLPPGEPTAIAAWHEARSKHKGDSQPPPGVPVFWSGGGPGHVAVSVGNGWVVTSDFPSAGHVTKVPISLLDAAWHLRYLGWTDDLEGVRVH
jgi:hypothetical protein